jgi:hypothetical protein
MLPAMLRQREQEESRRRLGLDRLGHRAAPNLAAKAEMRLQRAEQEAEEAELDILRAGCGPVARPVTPLPGRAGAEERRAARTARSPVLPPQPAVRPAMIVPRATANAEDGFSPEHYAPLPVLFLPVQDTRAESDERPSESAAFVASESTMGHCPDVGMSTTMSPEQREEWRRELGDLSNPELKKRYASELRTHRRILRDAKNGKCVVVERWQSFRKFLQDMGPKSDPSHTLDRINPRDPVYGPSKCRWLNKVGQARNRTSNVFLRATWKGEVLTLTIAGWAERTGQKAANIYKRHQRRDAGVPDWKIIGHGACPTPDDAPATSPHSLPPGWDRCPRAFALRAEQKSKTRPPKDWVMFHLAFQKATPAAKRLLATVPVFLAWCARERLVEGEHVLQTRWDLETWAGSGYVPRALLTEPVLEGWLTSRAILEDAEAMLTDAEWEFLESLRLPASVIINRHREPIHDAFAAVRGMMKFALPPSAKD